MRSRRRTIIITGLLALLVCYIAMNPREEKQPYFTVQMGDVASKIVLTDDWAATKDQIFAKIKPMWDDLESGNSEPFYLEVTRNSQPGWVDKDDFADEGEVSFTTMTSSPKYRFYKARKASVNSKPMSGYETVNEKGQALRMSNNHVKNWEDVRVKLGAQFDKLQDEFTQ